MSNEARLRDIAALLARGVIRVKKQPLALAIKSRMPMEQYASKFSQDLVKNKSEASQNQSQNGGDQ